MSQLPTWLAPVASNSAFSPAGPRTARSRDFRVCAWRGRLFTDADELEGAPPVAVMSFHIGQAKYGCDVSVAGSTHHMNGHPFTIIGIAPPTLFPTKGRCATANYRG